MMNQNYNPRGFQQASLPSSIRSAGVPSMMVLVEQLRAFRETCNANSMQPIRPPAPLHEMNNQRVAGRSAASTRKREHRSHKTSSHKTKHKKPSASTITAAQIQHDFENNEFFSFPCNHEEMREQKDRFLVFIRILFKYLEYRDPTTCQKVKSAIRDLAFVPRGERGPKGEVSLLLETYRRLRGAVSRFHWESSLTYYHMFLAKRRQLRAATMSGIIIPAVDDG
mmetsp:Transcript_2329/g.3178  ORF Transcript_2329/g.3178 Transcript_2329/m.3178 type:complete len:224 (+) Transcript_2329:136-807(+)